MESKLQQKKVKKEANGEADQVIRLSASSFLKILHGFLLKDEAGCIIYRPEPTMCDFLAL